MWISFQKKSMLIIEENLWLFFRNQSCSTKRERTLFVSPIFQLRELGHKWLQPKIGNIQCMTCPTRRDPIMQDCNQHPVRDISIEKDNDNATLPLFENWSILISYSTRPRTRVHHPRAIYRSSFLNIMSVRPLARAWKRSSSWKSQLRSTIAWFPCFDSLHFNDWKIIYMCTHDMN